MAKTVLSCVEIRDGQLKKLSLECLTAARQIAGSDGTVLAASADALPAGAAAELGAYGATKVLQATSDALGAYSAEGYTTAFETMAKQAAPDVIVIGYSGRGREIAGRLGAQLDTAIVPDCTAIVEQDGQTVFTHPVFAGKALVTMTAQNAKPVIVAIRPNVFSAVSADGAEATVEDVAVDIGADQIKATLKEVVPPEPGRVELTEADVIIAGGRGLKGPEHFSLIETLAKELSAAVGASRAAVDAGWIDHTFQVGQTGKVVSPSLYIACGISGAIQHMAGMRTSKCIVAINKDPEAPIFNVADYGVVGDLFEVVPALTEEVQKAKAAG